ncbi:MAG: hypothetical protein HPY75_02665 [Actinobacteria bacterium]|nr:hypothetical protein [Actinomycetota bacterium]
MKKASTLLLSSLLAVSLAFALAGCGQSSEDKALRFIGRGDASAYRMASEGQRMSDALQEFFDVLQGPNPQAIVEPGGPLEEYEDAREEMSSYAARAEAEFQGVLDLGGVEEEKQYATMMIEVASKTKELAGFVEEWFNKALDVIKTLDEKKIRSYLTGDEFEGGLAEIDEMKSEIDKLAGKAKDYRLENDF